ncbi:MAG: hypothetical protein K2M87_01305 [Muribaculaceae bacterium]|nr:hypothetical protein [Muribaculaceae bacterium]
MKKLLLTLLCLIAALPAIYAEDASFDVLPSQFPSLTSSYALAHYTDKTSGIGLSGHINKADASHIGMQKSGGHIKLTANPKGYIITKIDIQAKSSNTKTTSYQLTSNSEPYLEDTQTQLSNQLPGTLLVTQSISTTETIYSHDIDDLYFALRNSTATGQIQISKITIYYKDNSTPPTPVYPTECQAPEFSSASGSTLGAGMTITATSATVNSTVNIYSSTDGTLLAAGEEEAGTVSYTIPADLVNTTLSVYAIATCAGADNTTLTSAKTEATYSITDRIYFKKVTSTDDLKVGKIYTLAYYNSNGSVAMSNAAVENHPTTTPVECDDNEFPFSDEIMLLELSGDETDGWKWGTKNYQGLAGYLAMGSSNTDLFISEETPSTEDKITSWVSFTSQGNVQITFDKGDSRIIKYNSPTNDFRYYTSSNGVNIQLYELVTSSETPTPEKTEVTLAWDKSYDGEYTVDQSDVTPVITVTPAAAIDAVTVTSSNPEVATVTTVKSTEGINVTLNFLKASSESVSITASIAEDNENYTAEPISFTFTVKDKNEPVVTERYFKKVTNTADIKAGKTYTLACYNYKGNESVAMSNKVASSNDHPECTTINCDGNRFDFSDDVMLLKLSGSQGNWIWETSNYKGGTGTHLSMNATATHLYIKADSSKTYAKINDDGDVEISVKSDYDRTIRLYATTPDFRYYGSSNGIPVQLYELVEPTVVPPTPEKTQVKLAWLDTYAKEYKVDDTVQVSFNVLNENGEQDADLLETVAPMVEISCSNPEVVEIVRDEDDWYYMDVTFIKESSEPVTFTASIPESCADYTAEPISFKFTVKGEETPVVVIGQVTASVEIEEGEIHTYKGTQITFTSENASKLKIESEVNGEEVVEGDTYVYTATEDDTLTITPLDAAGAAQEDKALMVEIFVYTRGEIGKVMSSVKPDKYNTINTRVGKVITFSSEYATKLKIEDRDYDSADQTGIAPYIVSNPYNYKVEMLEQPLNLIITPIDENDAEHTDKALEVTISVQDRTYDYETLTFNFDQKSYIPENLAEYVESGLGYNEHDAVPALNLLIQESANDFNDEDAWVEDSHLSFSDGHGWLLHASTEADKTNKYRLASYIASDSEFDYEIVEVAFYGNDLRADNFVTVDESNMGTLSFAPNKATWSSDTPVAKAPFRLTATENVTISKLDVMLKHESVYDPEYTVVPDFDNWVFNVTLTHPDNHHIYYKVNGGNTANTYRDSKRRVPGEAVVNGHDLYDEPFTLAEGQTISMFAQHKELGKNSEPINVTFQDIATGVFDLRAEDAAGAKVRYFNMQGMEINAPVKGEPCIRVQGNSSKVVIE